VPHEADRVGERVDPAVLGRRPPGGRVEGGEQRVLDQHPGLGQAVEQARLAGGGSGRGGGAGGGVGLRGPGETKLETDRRRINTRISRLRREIKAMRTVRTTKRSRRASSGVPAVAIAGYTNAGKSSLLNRLTQAGVIRKGLRILKRNKGVKGILGM